jgi:hypothetical protein
VEANSTGGQGSRRAVAPSDDIDNEIHFYDKGVRHYASRDQYMFFQGPKQITVMLGKARCVVRQNKMQDWYRSDWPDNHF